MVFLIRDSIQQSGSEFLLLFAGSNIKTAPICPKAGLQLLLLSWIAQILSVAATESKELEEIVLSSLKSTIERIRALETERRNLMLEIEELKRMADAKAKALESEITMLRDEVKSLRILLSGEELDADFGQKKKR